MPLSVQCFSFLSRLQDITNSRLVQRGRFARKADAVIKGSSNNTVERVIVTGMLFLTVLLYNYRN